jgi:hypothetical protein
MSSDPLSGLPIYSIPLHIQIAQGVISQMEVHDLVPGQLKPL